MTSLAVILLSLVAGAIIGAAAGYRVGKREAVRDDLRFVTSRVVELHPVDVEHLHAALRGDI